MKYRNCFIAPIIVFSVLAAPAAFGQMKSCCEPEGVVLVSSVKQSTGTLQMVKILDSIGRNADPEDFFLMNNARMELFGKKLATEKDPYKRLDYYFRYSNEALNAGHTDEAIAVLTQVMESMKYNAENLNENNKIFYDLLAIAFMRKGELENCAANHTAESCIIPIQGGGIHKLTSGSSSAIEMYKMILAKFPDDLQSRYLLNIAYMTLGQYPAGVPEKWLIKSDVFTQNKSNIVLKDVAVPKGVDMNGISGGCVVEDLDNDGLLDIMASSYGLSDQIRYLHQQTDGTFKNETLSSGLVGITGGLNLIHADYNNDGLSDIIVLRGGWLGKDARFPFSLIRNNGNNRFDDVTIEAGLFSAAPTQTASWGDFNNDGWIDLFVSHEGYPCQLFMNNKGTFKDVAPKYGLNISAFVKGCIWGDINNDGFPELYLSILNSPNKLWLNLPGKIAGERSFSDISRSAGVEEPLHSFPTWFFDYDNDGYQDLYVSGYDTKMYSDVGGDAARDMLGLPTLGAKPRLYRNNGNNSFTNVSTALGIDHVNYTMGCNFGDIDNDGWLDFYLGTGAPDFTSIVPNKLYHNLEGKKFEDITYATNTGHIQKGHAVAFADIDNDGDQELYMVMGGANEGDRFRNVLFENSSKNDNHWIKLKLEGIRSNKAAIGARIRVTIKMPNGDTRNLYRVVNTGGSFGSSPLLVSIGLGTAVSIEEIEVKWPNPENSSSFLKNVQMDRLVIVTETKGR